VDLSRPTDLYKLLSENNSNGGGDTQNVSEQPMTYESAAPSVTQQQIAFHDENSGTSLDFEGSSVSQFDTSAISGVDLGDFISRPVLIDSFNWVEGAFFAHSFDPWTLFLSNSVIKKKLDNYGLLRMNLKLKFIISASPFYYGLGLISYNPMPSTHPGPQIVISSDEQMVTYSQRPNLWIHPSKSEGGEMVLPFFYDQNWLANRSADIARMGEIRYDSPYALANANSVVGSNVTVRCYAWAENAQLAAPTVQLQAGRSRKVKRKPKNSSKPSVMDRVQDLGANHDEYADGPVSQIASAVANAGAALSNVPVIGPFARATEIGASAVSRVASWFGFTNVPVISNVQPFKDLPFAGFASSEIGAPTPKLTLDPKNELTLDSRTVGLDGTDELSLESYVGRESYLTSFLWDTTDAPDTVLWATTVAPSVMYRENSSRLWCTPMAHASTMYQYWTGDIIFRFRVIATRYHRGRFKIQFDPTQLDLAFDSFDETANITRIYDIGETDDIEICVPYMQALAFLKNLPLAAGKTPFSTTPGAIGGVPDSNGILAFSVCNESSSPVANAPIQIVVSVRAGDNLKFMGPVAPIGPIEWVTQSSVTLHDSMGDCNEEEPSINLVYGGETALSLRQLLHRHCYVRGAGIQDSILDYSSTFYMYPESRNNAADVRNINTDGATPTPSRRNYVRNSFVSWLSPCFAGRRGSMYWAINTGVDAENTKTSIVRAVNNSLLPTTYNTYSPIILTTAGTYSYSTMLHRGEADAGNGIAVYNSGTQTGVTALVPYINQRRFVGTFPSPFVDATTTRLGVDPGVVKFTTYDSSLDAAAIVTTDFYCAAGPDFNLFFFTGVPTIRVGATFVVPT